MRISVTAILASCIVGLSACGGGGGSGSSSDSPTPPPVGGNPPPPPPPGPKTTFSDATAASGLNHVYDFDGADDVGLTGTQLLAGGVAAGDVNGDGLIDVYTVAGDSAPNRLFLNNGDNTFTDETARFALDLTHAGSGPTFADIDGDGDLDMFIGSAQEDRIYLLRRDGDAYVDVTATSGIAITVSNTVSAAFGDYDGDGDLDLFTSHWFIDPQADMESL